MTILVKIFGDLIKKVDSKRSSIALPLNLNIEHKEIRNISDILKKLSIEEQETSHIFVNGTYSGFKKRVNDGDRVGLFPKRMGLLYKWYFTKEEDE